MYYTRKLNGNVLSNTIPRYLNSFTTSRSQYIYIICIIVHLKKTAILRNMLIDVYV